MPPKKNPFLFCFVDSPRCFSFKGKASTEFNPNAKNPSPGGPYKSGPNELKGKKCFEIVGNPLGLVDDDNTKIQNLPLFDLPQDIWRLIRR